MFLCSVVALLLPVLMSLIATVQANSLSTEDYLATRCESRCIAQEDSSASTCTSATCLLCIKPCGHKLGAMKDCGSVCVNGKYTKKSLICIKSCKFLKKLYKNAHKPGRCPAVVDTSVCGSRCTIDIDCPEQQKCCIDSQCDNRTCHTPLFERPANKQQMRQSNLTMIPPVAKGFTVTDMTVIHEKAELQLVWKPPRMTGFRVHRYKLFWSKRLDSSNPKHKLASLRVYQDSVLASIHSYTLQGLECDTIYMLELQVVYQHGSLRVRSKREFLAVRTPTKGVTKVKKPPHKENAQLHKNRWWKKRKLPWTEPVTTKVFQTTTRSPTHGPSVADVAAKQSRAVQATKSLSGLMVLAPVLLLLLFTS